MALQGKGFYIWKIRDAEGGNAQQIALEAREAGLSHVLIKVANGIYAYNYDWNRRVDLVPPVVSALHAMGIQAWGWHYVYGDSPTGEANIALKRIRELNLDGYVINAEVQYKQPGKARAARQFMQKLRSGVGNNFPLALSSYRFPSLHPIPWDEFLSRCDYNMPQVYWMQAHNPGAQLSRTLQEFSNLKYKPPIIPTGAAFTEHGWSATAQDVLEFLIAARSFNLSAANFWEWYNCREVLKPRRQVWNTIADYNWDSGTTPPQDITARLFDALNSRDPNRVANLYTERAVHVTAARTIVGRDKIRTWYQTLFNQVLPNGVFFLTSFSGSGNSRSFTWTARSTAGNVNNGSDTLGLMSDQIAYHYSQFSVS